MSTHFAAESSETDLQIDDECGYPAGSFACRIRHIHLNTGDAKAAND